MSDLHDDDHENGDEGQEELTAEQLQEQIAKKEEDIQFLKGKWGEEKSEMKRELDTLKMQLSQFEGRISEQREMMSSKKQPEKDPYELDEDVLSEYRDDPAKIISFFKDREQVIKREQSELVNLISEALRERDNLYNSELGNIKKELDPKIQSWKPAIQELRQNEKLQKLDDETLIEIAKMRDMKPLMEYRGEVGGQRGREERPKPQPFDPNHPHARMLLSMFNGNQEAAKRAWDRAESKKGLK